MGKENGGDNEKDEDFEDQPEEEKEEEDLAEETYFVEKIVDHKREGATIHFLVKWYNYPEKDNSWISEEDLDDGKMKTDYLKTFLPHQLKDGAPKEDENPERLQGAPQRTPTPAA
eukprot:TRINITY_DN88_c0_g2_i1.p1 TRINITY_DN88_c0_g2~~TRINITY_DN88_c0_g2_i1.p1  ORF type:complete len:115 (+),score=36.88 TRINITY_DN88_c0_g2_i1:56-400(+)